MFLGKTFSGRILRRGGATEYGQALAELDAKLSRHEFLVSDTGFFLPVIFFISDGMPTDMNIWESRLEKLYNTNKWFRYATKIAIGIGEDAYIEGLVKITGTPETVVQAYDSETLIKLIVNSLREVCLTNHYPRSSRPCTNISVATYEKMDVSNISSDNLDDGGNQHNDWWPDSTPDDFDGW